MVILNRRGGVREAPCEMRARAPARGEAQRRLPHSVARAGGASWRCSKALPRLRHQRDCRPGGPARLPIMVVPMRWRKRRAETRPQLGSPRIFGEQGRAAEFLKAFCGTRIAGVKRRSVSMATGNFPFVAIENFAHGVWPASGGGSIRTLGLARVQRALACTVRRAKTHAMGRAAAFKRLQARAGFIRGPLLAGSPAAGPDARAFGSCCRGCCLGGSGGAGGRSLGQQFWLLQFLLQTCRAAMACSCIRSCACMAATFKFLKTKVRRMVCER